MSDSDKQDFHNQGQTDASNGIYKPPTKDPLTFIVEGYSQDELDRIESYKEGHSHAESQKSGGCFLTTACVQAAGLSDDCRELTMLRNFRDTFIRRLDGGEEMIRKYYALSPRIVEKLSADELESIYATVQLAVAQIGCGEFKEAFSTYAAMFDRLCAKHLGVRA